MVVYYISPGLAIFALPNLSLTSVLVVDGPVYWDVLGFLLLLDSIQGIKPKEMVVQQCEAFPPS